MATTGTYVKRARKPKLSNTLESLKPVIERAVEFSPGCNLFASGQGDDSMTMKRKAPVGRRTARVMDKSIQMQAIDLWSADSIAGEISPVASGTEAIYWDAELPGLGIRRYKSGRQVYFVQYRERGRTRRRQIASVDEIETRTARRRARKILSAVSLGLGVEDPFKVESGNEAIRFDAFVEQFWSSEAHRWKPSTKATNRRLIDHYLVPAFGAVAVADITQPMILKWRDGMSERAGTANRTLPVMSGMMRVAETMGLRPRRSNPCRFIQRYKANNRIRYLSLDELARFGAVLREFEADHPHDCAMIWLLLFTGARSGEIASLKNDWIDNGFFHLPDSKTGPRPIYVGEAAREIVASLALNDAHEWTFPHPSGEGHLKISQFVWTDIRKRAGLEDFRLHDLRHTFASYAVMNGVSLPTVSRLLGHAILQTTERYAHLSSESTRAAAGRVVGHLARATGFTAKGAGK